MLCFSAQLQVVQRMQQSVESVLANQNHQRLGARPLQIVSLLLLAVKQVPEALAQFDAHIRLFR